MLARVFVSPAFLYRAETAPPGKVTGARKRLRNGQSPELFSLVVHARCGTAKGCRHRQLHTPAAVQAQARSAC